MSGQSLAEELAELSVYERAGVMQGMPQEEIAALLYDWDFWARPDQKLPDKIVLDNGKTVDWFLWALISGRGSGKTRTGAETVKARVGGPTKPPIRIALIAESAPDARDIMVEGESGILAVSAPWNRPEYQPSKRKLTWPNGSVGLTFSGDKPEQLRGPQFDFAWVDELAKFQYPEEVWDNLEFGMRLGINPQVILTTTPKPIKILRELMKDELTVVTRVATYANIANLAPNFIRRVVKKYEGTRLGRQELLAEMLGEVQGAMWTRDMLEANRVTRTTVPKLDRIVIGVDPATSSEDESNETGIVVGGCAGVGLNRVSYTLKDASDVYTPNGWATKVKQLYVDYNASKIVAEKNQGGEMISTILHNLDPNLPVKLISAVSSKSGRAEPIAALMEQGRDKHVGTFGDMEDQMVAMTPQGYLGTGSPDRTDAKVWMTRELMLGEVASENEEDYADYRR